MCACGPNRLCNGWKPNCSYLFNVHFNVCFVRMAVMFSGFGKISQHIYFTFVYSTFVNIYLEAIFIILFVMFFIWHTIILFQFSIPQQDMSFFFLCPRPFYVLLLLKMPSPLNEYLSIKFKRWQWVGKVCTWRKNFRNVCFPFAEIIEYIQLNKYVWIQTTMFIKSSLVAKKNIVIF